MTDHGIYWHHVQTLYRVTCRMAELRRGASECVISDCRRARRCVGRLRQCMWRMPDRPLALSAEETREWSALAYEREVCVAALKRL